MLKTVPISRAKKTSGCAVTYRSGSRSCFGTCPSDCALNPEPKLSVQTVDRQYFKAVLSAVPHVGVSFTYTHFNPVLWQEDYELHRRTGKPTTTVNFSADDLLQARVAVARGLPTVVALPKGSERRVVHSHGLKVVRCPAEYQPISCAQCGGSKGPLCARPDRDYVIAFYGHGATAKHVGTDTQAGCYAASGNVWLHWEATLLAPSKWGSEASQLTEFVRTLPQGMVLRHHVAGDIGAES